ncbi:MAG TPA: hypothetical protein VJO99_07050 [Burkholderiaceae bacterium]|nr:hypothetical protein [Burkholderiaceae bacterium]
MNRFALPAFTPVVVEHINLRDESHGDDKVPAVDIKLSKEMHNSVLEQFAPGLRSWLYFKSTTPREAAKNEPQGALELDEGEPNDRPDLRFPELDVLKWHGEQLGRVLTLEYGIGGKSNVRLSDCRANEFRLECKEGGTVKVTWRVQRAQPDERAVGKLSSLLKHEVQAMLVGSPESESLLEQNGSPSSSDDDVQWPFETSVGTVNGEPLEQPAP